MQPVATQHPVIPAYPALLLMQEQSAEEAGRAGARGEGDMATRLRETGIGKTGVELVG